MAGTNKDFPSKTKLSIAVTAAVSVVPGVQAQTDDVELEEILVTATKREVSIQDVPIAITAFGEEEIVFQRFRNFADYVGQIPSLAVTDRQPGAQSVVMRGCAAQGLAFADSATTSVYLDEQPITSSGFNPDPRLIDVARVEALAGPQGTLFGDASQCGTLRVITNKPDATQSSGWIELTGSSVTDGGSGIDVSAMANIPLIQDKLALRLVGFYADEPGWIDNVLSPSPGRTFNNAAFVGDDVNSSVWQGARAMLRFNPNENWTIDAGVITQKYELDGFGDSSLNQQFYADTSVFPTFGEREQARFSRDEWEDEWYQAALTIEGNLSFGNVVLTAAYFDRDSEYFADATGYLQSFQQRGDYFRSFNTGNPYYDVGGIYDFGGDPLAGVRDTRKTKVDSFELRYSTPAEGRWSAIVGGFYSNRTVDEIFTSNVQGVGSTAAGAYINYAGYVYYGVPFNTNSNNWFSGAYNAELKQYAIFGEFSYDLTENFTVTAGGRYYNIENEYLNQRGTHIGVDGGIPNCTINYCYGVSEPGLSDEDGFVPKFNLTYKTGDHIIYGTYSEGFRRGGANSSRPQSVFGPPGRFPAPAGTLSEYESDTITNVELGVKTEWMGKRLRVNAAIYQMTWDDIQIQADDPQPTVTGLGIINFPEAEIEGAEAWISWIPSENWNIEATVGVNDGELSQTAVVFPGTDSELRAPAGTRLPIVPDFKASLNVEYNFPNELWGGYPYMFLSYNYTGDSVNSLAGIESSEFSSPVTTQASWNTIDFQVGLEKDNWALTFFIDNLTDESAQLFFNNRFNQQRLSVNQPRTVGVNFRYNFGGK
ncbi:MAG: TonB-dependent receptor [Pseudomonadota bacterium]